MKTLFECNSFLSIEINNRNKLQYNLQLYYFRNLYGLALNFFDRSVGLIAVLIEMLRSRTLHLDIIHIRAQRLLVKNMNIKFLFKTNGNNRGPIYLNTKSKQQSIMEMDQGTYYKGV